jgi:dTDP-4-dehydrorhamnose 3,5-epimerase
VIFTETGIAGLITIVPERFEDERGFFARSWCREEFERHGLNPNIAQCNISYNRVKGTLRGMHYQAAPHAEAKLIRCTAGSIYDVAIDLRRGSKTFLRHEAVVLSAKERNMLYIPEGFAHGFQTLEDDTEVSYQMSAVYEPTAGRGVRWNDPIFGIDWPSDRRTMCERDANYPDFVPGAAT